MDTRYLSLVAALAILGLISFFKVRRIGRGSPSPLLPNPTGGERNRVRLYVSIIAVLTLILTGALGAWSILSDPR
ncbi:hypothetical protein [Brevundimonas sp.]|uniref:hypothetical protein n=1 Tax=Brevundimonas sp. TaxID=1871086 RepID=UPI002D5828DA|nr:hypothetical protein [Brevundimonas sp.]HYC98217.1 hypothetical protein [Brevundimonas sp.]